MKKILLALLAVTVAGCASNQLITAAPQVYRLKDREKPVNITGTSAVKTEAGPLSTTMTVFISIAFDGVPKIQGNLGQDFNAELQGADYAEKPTSASCTSKQVTKNTFETRCIVFIDNERTVTLTF